MHARLSRTKRTLALAASLGLILVLHSCSAEDSAAPDTESAAAESSEPDAATEKQAPENLAAGKLPADPKAFAGPTAADLGADSKADARAKGKGAAQMTKAEYSRQRQELTEQLKAGKIDSSEFRKQEQLLNERMRAPREAPKPVDPNGSKLVFATKEKDFGTVWDTADLMFEFAFENQGKQTLEITKVKPSCGCTSAPLGQRSFEPGKGDLIPIVWKPKGTGPQKKTITISHNNGPDIVLNISANVQAFVELEPKLLRLNDLEQHQEHHSQVKLILADKNFEITKITPKSPHLTATEQGRDEEGNILIDVVIKDTAPWGNFNARLEIEGTGVTEEGAKPITHMVAMQVIAKLFGDIRVEPQQIQLGVIPQNSKFHGEALLYHINGDEFGLAEISMRFSRPPMTVTWEKATKDGKPAVKILIDGDTTGFPDRFVRGTIFFKTDLGDSDNQQLQISGSVR